MMMKFNQIKTNRLIRVFALTFALIAVSSGLYAAPRTVILLPFVSDGNRGYSWIASGINDYLERAMRGNSSIGVIPSSDVRIISQYLKITPNTPLPPELISQLVRLSGADEAVSIRYFVTDGKLSISIELISGKNGNVRKSFSFFEPIDRVYDVEDAIYRGIVSDETPVLKTHKAYRVKRRRRWVWVQPKKANITPFEWYSRALESMNSDPQSSLSLFVRTLRNDPEHVSALVAASSIVHNVQNNIDGALGYLLRADKIFVRRGESSTTKYASLMVKIADIYDHKKNYARAQVYLNRAFDVWKKRKSSFPDEYGAFLTDVGQLYLHAKRPQSAVDYLSMARDAYEKRGRADTLRYAWIMRFLAESYYELGRDSAADECFRISSAIYKKLELDGCGDFAEIEYGRGKSLAALGKIDEAGDVLESAYNLFAKLQMNDRAKEALSSMHSMKQPMSRRWRD